MAATNCSRVAVPFPLSVFGTIGGFSNFSLDGSGDKLAFIWQAKDSNAITHLGFRYGLRTGTPPTYKISAQSVSTTDGFPTGTILGGGSPAEATFTPPADTTWNGTVQAIALDNSYTPAPGDRIATVIEYSAGTIDGSNFSSFTQRDSAGSGRFPYALQNTGGGYAHLGNVTVPMHYVRTASSRYGNAYNSLFTTAISNTTGHRGAMAFTLPAGNGDTFTVKGMSFYGLPANGATGTMKLGLWEGTTERQGIDLDANQLYLAAGWFEYLFDESSLHECSFGTEYRIGFEQLTSGGHCAIYGFQLGSADDLALYPYGSACFYSGFNGTSWTDDATVRPMVELIIDDITEPAAGGGGLLTHPGMAGGMRG